MGRPRLPRDEQGNIIRPPKVDAALAPAKIVEGGRDEFGRPPKIVKGRANPEYFRVSYKIIADSAMRAAVAGASIPFNSESLKKLIDAEAEACGFDPKRLQDQRTPEQLIDDAVEKLRAMPSEHLELLDAELDALERESTRIDEGCRDYLEGICAETDGMRSKPDPKKTWRGRLKRIRRLREQARKPVWNKDIVLPMDEWAQEAAHPGRFMLYVSRSNMEQGKRHDTSKGDSPADSVLQMPDHFAKLLCDLYLARRGIRVGVPYKKPGALATLNHGEVPTVGFVGLLSMGHGKTELVNNYAALEVCQNEKTQGMMLHAILDEAVKNLAYVKAMFDIKSAQGRRRHALFPKVELADKNNNSKQMRIKTKFVLKQPTLTASGVSANALGSNTNIVFGDDIVPQSDTTEPTERARRSDIVAGTWLSRQRGQRYFSIFIGTPWHFDDALMRLVGKARRYVETKGREGICMAVSRQGCGGPKSSPAFKPLWPDGYPASELRARYATLGPRLYSAAMEMQPLSEGQRIIKKFRLYDPATEEHGRFVSSCVKYLSLDPAATRGERSDMAGVIYAGMGTIGLSRKNEDGHEVFSTEKRIRLFEAIEMPATQSDLVEHTVQFSGQRPVDYVLAECRSGFVGIAEMFENYHGIDVRRLDPKNKSKEERLRAAAPALDDSSADIGFRAVVELPGVWVGDGDHARLVLDDRFKKLSEQVLDFGVCPQDHLLDALTQLVIDCSPDLGIGVGSVTMAVKQQERIIGDPRIHRMIEAAMSEVRRKKDADDATDWVSKNWSEA